MPSATGDEDELETWPVRRIADLLDLEPSRTQRGFDLITVAEPQCRVRGDDGTVGLEHEGPPEAHEVTGDVDQIAPALDRTDTRYDGSRLGPLTGPLAPRLSSRVARLEHQAPAGAKRGVNPRQRGPPRLVIEKDLRDVAGHLSSAKLVRTVEFS